MKVKSSNMRYSVYAGCQFEGNIAKTIKTLNICANNPTVKGLSYKSYIYYNVHLFVCTCKKTVNTQMCIKRELVK